MIVRISNEGQYEISDSDIAELNDLDNKAVVACEGSDEQRFRDAFVQLLTLVRDKGTPLPDDELIGSDIILPPADVSLEEASEAFQGDGLIPEMPAADA
jgi:hypothetical protein